MAINLCATFDDANHCIHPLARVVSLCSGINANGLQRVRHKHGGRAFRALLEFTAHDFQRRALLVTIYEQDAIGLTPGRKPFPCARVATLQVLATDSSELPKANLYRIRVLICGKHRNVDSLR
jgi:hypothetical protein